MVSQRTQRSAIKCILKPIPYIPSPSPPPQENNEKLREVNDVLSVSIDANMADVTEDHLKAELDGLEARVTESELDDIHAVDREPTGKASNNNSRVAAATKATPNEMSEEQLQELEEIQSQLAY